MKKLYFSILFLILIFSNTIFANCLGDISQIGNARCITDYSNDTDVESMDTVTFGSYPQSSASSNELIEWIVLEKQGDKALLLSKYILDSKDFDSTNRMRNGIHSEWEDSTLREWLNNEFYNIAFDNEEQNALVLTNLYFGSVKVSLSLNHNTYVREMNTNDKLFCLSVKEINKYFKPKNFSLDNGKVVYELPHKIETSKTNYAISTVNGNNTLKNNFNFWLRDSKWDELDVMDDEFYFVELTDAEWASSGRDFLSIEYEGGGNLPYGVRPAMWVDFSNYSMRDNAGAYEDNNDYVDDEDNTDDDEIPEDYSNAGNMAKSDTVTWGMNGIDVTFKRADLKQGWVKDVEGRLFYFITFDAVNESCNFPNNGWKEIDGKYYYFTAHGYILTNTTTPDGNKVDRNGVLIEEVQETTTIPETTKSAPKNGWYGDYYYQNDVMTTNNWVEYNGDWYYCGPSGVILKSQWIDNTYYVDSNGKMLKNTITPTGNRVGADGKYIPDEIIDLDARNNTNKQEETKIQETKKQEAIARENNVSKIEKQEIPQYVLDAWYGEKEREPYILSDDGHTVVFQITKDMLGHDGIKTELEVMVPEYEEFDIFAKTYPEVNLRVIYNTLTEEERRLISDRISNSTIISIDDGVGGKYDYDMIKRAKICPLNNELSFAVISKKEAKRISDELNKKLEKDGKILIKIQYKEWDLDKGTYVVNPIYVGNGKVVVKKEGFIFKKVSMYLELEGEDKKDLQNSQEKIKANIYILLTLV